MTESLCVFEYSYRDAANYKQHEAVLLSGNVTSNDLEVIHASMNQDCQFIPEVVGLLSLQERFVKFGQVPDYDDHVWHEFTDLRVAEAADIERIKPRSSKDELVAAFIEVTTWDETRSPIYEALALQ